MVGRQAVAVLIRGLVLWAGPRIVTHLSLVSVNVGGMGVDESQERAALSNSAFTLLGRSAAIFLTSRSHPWFPPRETDLQRVR